eukprot:TRINITY_DN9706_c0_g1_i1.p1 TRINITY_DN9706_c0_g1~~TRINITY_DN9706_c0_g1_i1.p1  ORF type:complete len:154 (-),score=56.48 TRINITY_DN9706_c0_g1_i1:32-493(-)
MCIRDRSNVHVDEHDQEESRKPRGSLKVRNPAGPAIGISDARSYSMREELQFMIRNTTCGKIIGFVISVASFISIILYVVTSYMEEEAADNDDPLKWIDFMFDVLFLIDYVFFLYLADDPVSYTHLRAHETPEHLVCRLLLEKKKKNTHSHNI